MLQVSTYPGVYLQQGSKGNDVKVVQTRLNQLGYPCGTADGVFGPKTKACVVQFQTAQGLGADGVVGPITWLRLFDEIPATEPSVSTKNALKGIKSRSDVYQKPIPQDLVGRGIVAIPGQDGRSERVYPAYVLGPRRQVDSLVRQLLALLPTSNTAFLLTERLVQYPEEYLPYIASTEKAVLVGSFVGIGPNTVSGYPEWARARHDTEFWRLNQAVQLLKALNRPIVGVIYAMGDSPKPEASAVRASLQTRLHTFLAQNNLSALKQAVTWGADEAILMAIASTLPSTKIRIRISNPSAKQHYDGFRTATEVMAEKLPAMGLVQSDSDWAFEVAVLTRRPGGRTDNYESNDTQQAEFDEAFLAPYRAYSPEQRRKLVIIDGRMFNGAWDARGALPYPDLLAYGSWGTFGNAVGATLSAAKVLFYANNPVAQQQLYLEAVAHDVFANGYREAQRSGLSDKLKAVGIPFNHYNGYETPDLVAKVFEVLNKHVNQRMQEHFKGAIALEGRTFRLTPQLWRTFESEVHLVPPIPGEVFAAGIFRKDLNPKIFNPNPQ